MLEFEWDEANIKHIARHGIQPEQAEQAMLNEPLDLGPEVLNGELRLHHIGETREKKVLFIVVTTRGEKVRVVTCFPASPKLRKYYAEKKRAREEARSSSGIQE